MDKFFERITPNSTPIKGKFKNNRLIFTIDYRISREELTKIITSCEIDFFTISTTSFHNVNEYYGIIEDIKEICLKFDKIIGIIAELRGRKITVEKIKPNTNVIHLKKGQTITIEENTNEEKLMTDENRIVVNFKEFHKLLRVKDKIIIDDNVGSLTVKDIIDVTKYINKTTDIDEQLCTNEEKAKEKSRSLTYENINRLAAGKWKKFSSEKVTDQKAAGTVSDGYSQLESEENDPFEKGPEVLYDCEDYIKKLYQSNVIDNFIKTNAEKYTIQIDEYGYKMESDANNFLHMAKRRQFPSKPSKKVYEILCTVDYDCELNKNSFMFVPNADFKQLKVNLLTNREVGEIDHLNTLGVDYIVITISDMEDIKTIIGEEGVLGVDSRVKIIAAIPDYRSLINIDEILGNSSGLILSRTFFQTYNKHIRNSLSRMTKYLIYKCRDMGRPIFAYVDVNDQKIYNSIKEQKLLALDHDIMEGMDGFFLNVNRFHSNFTFTTRECGLIDHVDIINFFSKYFKSIQSNHSLLDLESSSIFNDKIVNSQTRILPTLIKGIDNQMQYVMVYMGDIFKNVRNISRLKKTSPLIVISSNKEFLQQAQLYYSTYSLYQQTLPKKRQDLEKIIMEKFQIKSRIIFINNNREVNKISVKILSSCV